MGAYVVRMISLAGVVALVILLAVEIRNWRSGRKIINHRQQIIRLLTAALMILLLSLIFIGSLVVGTERPFVFLFYWMGCFIIGCSVVLLMLMDLREVANRYREQHRDIIRRMAEESKRKQ